MKCKNCSMFEYCGLGGADGEKECTHPLFGKKPRRTEIDPMNNGEINQKEHTVLLKEKYTNYEFSIVLIWGYVILMIVFEFYAIRIFMKKR